MPTKTKQSHTEGPWRISVQPGYGIYHKNIWVAEINTDSMPFDEANSNARLIAAAPDLLEALRDGIGLYPIPSRMRTAALAAIAKATGEQP